MGSRVSTSHSLLDVDLEEEAELVTSEGWGWGGVPDGNYGNQRDAFLV
jgi:hypothetical protein